ncbi:MAG: GDSL-type esterase/lipase family protein [Myxococcota bacterium]
MALALTLGCGTDAEGGDSHPEARSAELAAAPPEVQEPVPSESVDVDAEPSVPAWQPRSTDPTNAPHPIEDPTGSLTGFYEALRRVDDEETGSLARVTHMGDSSIGMDSLPHFLRTRFQDRFGDGGAGFVLAQPHSPNYLNRAAVLSTPGRWHFCFIIHRCLEDGHYGLGGVAARSNGGSATILRTRSRGDYGRTVSRFEVWYAGMPRGGTIELHIDEQAPITVSTDSPTLTDRWHLVDVAPGAHTLRLRARSGQVRVYGVTMETDGPGVVWDTLSMIGAFTPRLLAHDPRHFKRQLQHRNSDLVVLAYGGNDLRRLVGGAVTAEAFREETRALLARVREALPDRGCLLTGIIEHERSGPTWVHPEHVDAIVSAQRAAARDAGCAFFDLYSAMGGSGGFRRWLREGLASHDLKHLTGRGRERVADWLYAALLVGYAEYRYTRASHLGGSEPAGATMAPH